MDRAIKAITHIAASLLVQVDNREKEREREMNYMNVTSTYKVRMVALDFN